MKKIAVMQPYFLPYIGYFQLMNLVDEFVVYDNIKFTKKGWIHRNRMLEFNKDVYFSLPVKNDSDYLDIRDRSIAESYYQEKNKLLNKIKNNYHKAPYFEEVYPVIHEIFHQTETNLFQFIYNSIISIKEYLGINTKITISSNINIDHSQRGKNKVILIVQALSGTHYINPEGGLDLYSKSEFLDNDIELSFIKTNNFYYEQFGHSFIPFLSIMDVMMFNDKKTIRHFLTDYKTL